MRLSNTEHRPVYVHLDEMRRRMLPQGEASDSTHLIIHVIDKTYSLQGKNHKLPESFTTEIQKIRAPLTADIAWVLFRRHVLGEPSRVHPAVHLNADLSQALVRNASTPLEPVFQRKLEGILFRRYSLFELLIKTTQHLEDIQEKCTQKQHQHELWFEELASVLKTIEMQKKGISHMPPLERKPALRELETMVLHKDHLERELKIVAKHMAQLEVEKCCFEETGIHKEPLLFDSLDPECKGLALEVAQMPIPFLEGIEKTIISETGKALELLERSEL